MTTAKAIVRRLAEHRTAIGLTQREVALRMNTVQSAVSDIENIGNPTLAVLLRYADAIGVDIKAHTRGIHTAGRAL